MTLSGFFRTVGTSERPETKKRDRLNGWFFRVFFGDGILPHYVGDLYIYISKDP